MPVQTRIQVRRGTAASGVAQWTTQTLYAGEIGYETDTGRFKIGDGTTNWNGLEYASVVPSGFIAGSGISIVKGTNGQDITISSPITAGSGIVLTHNSGTYNISVSTGAAVDVSGIIGLTEYIQDIIGLSGVAAGSGISINYNDTTGLTTVSLSDPTIQVGDITDFNEGVDDRVSNLLVAGTGVTLSYNDGSDTLTVSSVVSAGSGISVSHNAGAYTISLSDPTIQLADITDLSSNARTFLLTPSSSNLGTLVTDETGSGALVFATDPTFNNNITVSGTINNSSIASFGTDLVIDGNGGNVTIIDTNKLDSTSVDAYFTYGMGGSQGLDGDFKVINNATDVAQISLNISQLTLDVPVVTTSGLTVGGDLVVNGNTVTVNSTVTTLDDPIITLGGDTAPTSNDNKDRGVEFNYHDGSNPKVGFFGYDASIGKFTFIPDATNTSEVFSGTQGTIAANILESTVASPTAPLTVASTGTVTNLSADFLDGQHGSYYRDWTNITNKPDPIVSVNITGDVVGSGQATLTDLGNGYVSFSTAIQANSVALGTDTTGDYVASVNVSGSGLSVSGSGENATYTVSSNATPANIASTIVSRNSSGNFSAGTITADLIGNASTATALQTGRTINGTSFDGTQNITIAFVDGGTP